MNWLANTMGAGWGGVKGAIAQLKKNNIIFYLIDS